METCQSQRPMKTCGVWHCQKWQLLCMHCFPAIFLGKVEMVAGHSHTAQAQDSMKTCGVMT